MQVGNRILGAKQPLTQQSSLAQGKVYEVEVKASSGILDPQSITNYLCGKMNEQYPELRINYINVNQQTQTIILQFHPLDARTLGLEPQPQRLFVATLLAWLPAILTLVGIAVVGISVWEIIGTIPWYIWAILATGVALLFFAPTISSLFKGRAPTYILEKSSTRKPSYLI
jgi:type IV secretory pathway VirB2 component (pilin)